MFLVATRSHTVLISVRNHAYHDDATIPYVSPKKMFLPMLLDFNIINMVKLFHLLISILKETQEETYMKIRTTSKGHFNQMSLTDRQRLDQTTNEWNAYSIHQNRIKYLINIFFCRCGFIHFFSFYSSKYSLKLFENNFCEIHTIAVCT